MATEIPTVADLANLIVNTPARHRDYLTKIPPGILVAVAFGLKNRSLTKRQFTDALKLDYETHEAEEQRLDEAFAVPGCEVGQLRAVASEHWTGQLVEITAFVRRDPAGFTLRCMHNGVTYHMRPEWIVAS